MARAVTMESIGETAGAGSGPLPCHNTCRMELSPPYRGWPGVPTGPGIAATAGSPCTGPAHLRHSHHRLPASQAVYRPYPLPCLQPEGRGEQQSHQQGPVVAPAPTPLSLPPCSRRDEAEEGSISGQLSDSDRAEHPEAEGEQGPLPDLLPHNEHPPRATNQNGASRERAVRESEARRVGSQLRAIGDNYNAMMLRRAHAAPNWEDWRDACRGLLTFITQTLSTLYRLT